MCGICGILDRRALSPPPETIAAMLPALARRGPDHEGLHVEPGVALGHSRLAILDLSPAGHQPMQDPDLDLVVTFNGEIYNFHALRTELEAAGYRFRSRSDTEVLLKAYHAWGDGFVERLNGMFAFCLYDRGRRRALLARDRLGIKPLYYVDQPDRLVFASNIQALARAGAVPGTLDPVGLHHYLTFHAVVPAPRTVLADVRKLRPGTVMTLERDGARHERRYWDVAFRGNDGPTEEEWIEALLAALRTSVERRLVSDVPVGAFLSGGVDSSLIVGLMAERLPGFRTYSIGFEDTGAEEGNEFRYSDIVAKRFGTEHHKIFVDRARLLPELADCVATMAEPQVSHDAVGFFLLAREVSRESKVVLTGQGADEIFGGYHWYPKIRDDSGDAVDRYRRHFFDRDHAEVLEALEPAWHSPGDVSTDFVCRAFAGWPDESPVDQALHLDTTVMLVEDPVKRVDNMTMAWGLEARVPFLDHELVELAARIPAGCKLGDGGKRVLKRAAERVIPSDVIYRPKGYFPVPALKYLEGEYLEFARDILDSGPARARGVFRREYVNRLLADPRGHLTVLDGSKLWQVTLLEYWLQQLGC